MAHNRILAQFRLPFSFNVLSRLPQGQPRPAATKGKRTRREMEGAPSNANDRNVRTRLDEPPRRNLPGHEQTDHPMGAFNLRSATQAHDGSSSSPSPPASPPQNAAPNPEPISWGLPQQQQGVAQPRTEDEASPTLTEVNPESGSVTGGARIWLKGMGFPARFPLFARFGSAVVPTVSLMGSLSSLN